MDPCSEQIFLHLSVSADGLSFILVTAKSLGTFPHNIPFIP